MLRGENIVCGTTTTGTGTLTLAATPAAVGAIDPYTWLTSTGIGFANGKVVLVSYQIIEFADSTFAKPIAVEKGVGTVTLGASLTASTLARTTIQHTDVVATPAYNNPGTAYSIGTAANTLVMIAPSSIEIPALHPYYESTIGQSNWGVSPDGLHSIGGTNNGMAANNVHLQDIYIPFRWSVPMLVKRCSARIEGNSYTVGITAYMRLYDYGSDGKPGRLLYDFNSSGVAIASATTGFFSSGAAGSGFMLTPGDYFLDILFSITGGSGVVQTTTPNGGQCSHAATRGGFATSRFSMPYYTASSGTAGAGPDPANLTSFGAIVALSGNAPVFGLAPS